MSFMSRFFRQGANSRPEPPKALTTEGQSDPVSELVRQFFKHHSKTLNIGTPWITNAATTWLEANLRGTDTTLEFGVGRSTGWWASKVRYVTSVEGSPSWTIWVLMHLYARPSLLKKVRLYFCPAEWNPTFTHKNGLRDYWKTNRHSIMAEDIKDIERCLLLPDFGDHNILFLDGNIRFMVLVHKLRSLKPESVEMIVIDNTEAPNTSLIADLMIPDDYERLDFIAGRLDPIPSHQKGKHITTVWVRKDRLANCKMTETPYPIRNSPEDLRQFQHAPDYTVENAKADVEEVASYLRDDLHLSI